MKFPSFFNLFLVVFFTQAPLAAQSFYELLHDDAIGEEVAVVLTLPLDSLHARSRDEYPGTIAFTDRDGQPRSFSVDYSVRGKFRRTRCATPPLRLDLSKTELGNAGLEEHDKFKLVTTCYADSNGSELLLKEYLAYRAYALLSPDAHYRAQLLKVTYRDAAGNYDDRTDYAFLIEDTDEMAARAGGEELDEALGLQADRFLARAEATHALFQYLIGNGDWNLPLARNVKIVARPDGKLVPVGYDFDFSGWVGAPYASPTLDHGQQNIYDRVYLGYAQSDRVLQEVTQDFRSHRRELLRMIGDFDLLPRQERQVLQRFVQRFYNDMAEMSVRTELELYSQLRGSTADIIPPGAQPHSYRGAARR